MTQRCWWRWWTQFGCLGCFWGQWCVRREGSPANVKHCVCPCSPCASEDVCSGLRLQQQLQPHLQGEHNVGGRTHTQQQTQMLTGSPLQNRLARSAWVGCRHRDGTRTRLKRAASMLIVVPLQAAMGSALWLSVRTTPAAQPQMPAAVHAECSKSRIRDEAGAVWS